MQKNYAEYREKAKNTNPHFTEQQMFANWMKWEMGGWDVQSIPIKGIDDKYHMLYLSKRNDGLIYVGKHDTLNPNDNYIGSGLNVEYSTKSGYEFEKIPLAFFPNSEGAFAMEKLVVNEEFIKHPSVLNQDIGGDMTVHVDSSNTTTISTRKKKKTNAASFSELFRECKNGKSDLVGRTLTYIDDNNITCKVLDDWHVSGKLGNNMNLSAYTSLVKGGFRGNPLYFWKVDGERLDVLSTKVKNRRFQNGN